MLAEFLGAVQESALATTLRRSLWVYPFVNASHVVGLALLFGAILPLDLRLIGFWRSVSIAVLARVLLPVAIAGLGLAVVTGVLLFSVKAVEYADLTLFRIKLLLILCAVANALLLRLAPAWAACRESDAAGTAPRLRVAGALSLGLWLAVILCGRMIGYL